MRTTTKRIHSGRTTAKAAGDGHDEERDRQDEANTTGREQSDDAETVHQQKDRYQTDRDAHGVPSGTSVAQETPGNPALHLAEESPYHGCNTRPNTSSRPGPAGDPVR